MTYPPILYYAVWLPPSQLLPALKLVALIPHVIFMKGMMTLKQFLILIGLTELTFLKGKGRAFVGTPVGTVYKALKFDEKGPKYITVHRGGKTPDGKDMSHLEGTLWLVNSSVQLDGTYTE